MSKRYPSIRDVAAAAGVSHSTVSYVLSGRTDGTPRISEPTKERVLEAAKELGYVTNSAARGMRRGRTDTIAVVIENMESPWDRALAETANRILPAHGYRVVILLGQEAWRNFMLSGGADGVILGFSTETEDETRTILDLAKRGVAQVVVSQFLEPQGFDVLSVDAAGGIAEAAEYLGGRHERIGVIHRGTSAPGPRGTRLELFRTALAQNGVQLDDSLVRASGGSWRTAFQSALELLSLPEPPTAFFTTADLEALCVSGAATWKGLEIPDQLEIIGVENSQPGKNPDPALSTVCPDSAGHPVVELLLARMKGLPGKHFAPALSTVGPGPAGHLAVDLLLARLKGETGGQGRKVPVPWKLRYRGTTRHRDENASAGGGDKGMAGATVRNPGCVPVTASAHHAR